jgi:hypothetical protein
MKKSLSTSSELIVNSTYHGIQTIADIGVLRGLHARRSRNQTKRKSFRYRLQQRGDNKCRPSATDYYYDYTYIEDLPNPFSSGILLYSHSTDIGLLQFPLAIRLLTLSPPAIQPLPSNRHDHQTPHRGRLDLPRPPNRRFQLNRRVPLYQIHPSRRNTHRSHARQWRHPLRPSKTH